MPGCALVIFGTSSDLTERKFLPTVRQLAAHHRLRPEFAVVGVARTAMSDEEWADKCLAGVLARETAHIHLAHGHRPAPGEGEQAESLVGGEGQAVRPEDGLDPGQQQLHPHDGGDGRHMVSVRRPPDAPLAMGFGDGVERVGAGTHLPYVTSAAAYEALVSAPSL